MAICLSCCWGDGPRVYQNVYRMFPDGPPQANTNVGIPSSTIRYIERCGTKVWLIPKNQEPFTVTNGYFKKQTLLFSEEFRGAFLRSYRKRESRSVFDVWVCGAS